MAAAHSADKCHMIFEMGFDMTDSLRYARHGCTSHFADTGVTRETRSGYIAWIAPGTMTCIRISKLMYWHRDHHTRAWQNDTKRVQRM